MIDSPTKLSHFNSVSDVIIKIATGIRNSFVLLSTGEVYVFGDNSEGQSTGYISRYVEPTLLNLTSDLNDKVNDIIVGNNHVIIKGESGMLYSWGSSNDGKLGYNELKQSSSIPKPIQNLKGRVIDYIYAGKNFSVIFTNPV